MNTTLSAAGTASGGALSIMVVVSYLLSLRGITLPSDVALAAGTVIGQIIHYFMAVGLLPKPAKSSVDVAQPAESNPAPKGT